MSGSTLISVDEYLARTEKPAAEYVDGVLHTKAMPTGLHGILQTLIAFFLLRQNLAAAAEVRVQLGPTRYLVPDVIAAPRVSRAYPTDPPMLCIEILSPEDRIGATLAKCEEYHAWGVPHCWVIDPARQSAWQYSAHALPERLDRSGTLRAGDAAVSLDELFSAAMKLVEDQPSS